MLLPFGEFRPDVSDYNRDYTDNATNVLARADGYGPFRLFGALSRPVAEGNTSFTKVLLHFDGTDASTTITDSAEGGALTWTAAGNAQIDTAQSVFGGASLLCDGTGDWVSASDSADITHGSNDFHHHVRIRPATSAALLYIAGQGNSAGTAATSTFLLSRNASNKIIFELSTGSAWVTLTGTSNVVLGSWYSIEVSRVGNTIYLFVNGVLEDSDTFTGAANDSAEDIRVGAGGEITTTPFNGWIDEFAMNIGEPGHTVGFSPPGKAFDLTENGVCRGMFFARKTDGTVQVFLGTATKLFTLNSATMDWTDVSKAGNYTTLPLQGNWQFAQFGNFVIAVQGNANPQQYTLGSSTVFADLAGSPPPASFVAVVQSFVVLTGITATPFRIQWSGLEDATNWTSGSNSSDFQDLPDGGPVRSVIGGDFGVIFQDGVIRRMIWNQSTTTVFDINKITEDMGLLFPYSATKAGGNVYFWAQQGAQKIGLTGSPIAIGKEKVDRYVFANVDMEAMRLFVGASDPEGPRVFWQYKSPYGSTGYADWMVAYDYQLERWVLIYVYEQEYLATMMVPGTTLESLDNLFPNIDTMPISLDDISLSALPHIAAVDSTHSFGMFVGPTMQCTLETAELTPDAWMRVRVQGTRPITDAQECYVGVFAREGLMETSVTDGLEAMNTNRWVPCNLSGRLFFGFLFIEEGVEWTFATGLDPKFVPEGEW